LQDALVQQLRARSSELLFREHADQSSSEIVNAESQRLSDLVERGKAELDALQELNKARSALEYGSALVRSTLLASLSLSHPLARLT
jgi:hypothetical protein